MKRYVLFVLCFVVLGVLLVGCDRSDTIDVETTITQKVVREGAYYFLLEYELEGFHLPLTAEEKVTQRVYNQYQVGETYIFTRPAPKLD